jgi:hypothetical protein
MWGKRRALERAVELATQRLIDCGHTIAERDAEITALRAQVRDLSDAYGRALARAEFWASRDGDPDLSRLYVPDEWGGPL